MKLQGETHVEQKHRQVKIAKQLPESPEARAHKARRKSAQTIAKSKRRGMFGLLKAITNRHPK